MHLLAILTAMLPAITSLNSVDCSAMCDHAMPSESDTTQIVVAFTTDVHGSFTQHDHITNRPTSGSLLRISTKIKKLRQEYGSDNLLLLDGGDILQGQPIVYHSNYIDTVRPHVAAVAYSHMGYDAVTIGNHDLECGHNVYDRWESQLNASVLGANCLQAHDGTPYFEPYIIIEKSGIKIAILGLTSPSVPSWLPPEKWQGIKFEDMVSSAAYWVDQIKSLHQPDILIGLFHAGADTTVVTGGVLEHPSLKIAREIPGFDAVLFGHDHTLRCEKITNCEGKEVSVLNPGSGAINLGLLTIDICNPPNVNECPKVTLTPHTISIANQSIDTELEHLLSDYDRATRAYVSETIGQCAADISSQEAISGPTEFLTLLHDLQLQITQADISFAAPLSLDARISKGNLTVADMFALYKYDNSILTIKLTGREIQRYLEHSYDAWVNLLHDADLKYPVYNLDSAQGIDYTVSLSAPPMHRVSILQMSDGTEFSPDKMYRVAINSYRALGGGGLLTLATGITNETLPERTVWTSDREIRHYLTKLIADRKTIQPYISTNWKFL